MSNTYSDSEDDLHVQSLVLLVSLLRLFLTIVGL